MKTLFTALYHDDAGFVISAELILVSTVAVLGLVVGLSETAHGVNQELEDVGSAVGHVNQGYEYTGFTGAKARQVGSCFFDAADECDSQFDVSCDGRIRHEFGYGRY